MSMKSERATWGDFPKAITNDLNGTLIHLEGYQEAKAGNAITAIYFVKKLLSDETINQVKTYFKPDKNTLIVPVHAEEQSGINKIPMAVAALLAKKLGLTVESSIVQINRVHRTRTSSSHRLAFQAIFDGKVQKGKTYILVDDTLIQGGTLANLRGFIENRGGKVLGVMVMSAKQHSLQLAPTQETLNNIYAKHGNTMNEFWKKEFGYGIEQLTQSEAAHVLAATNVDAIRDRITQARFEGGSSIYRSGVGENGENELTTAITYLKTQKSNAILKAEKPTTPCRGRIVFHTENYVIQQVADNSRFYQAHAKKELLRIPDIGEKLNISYSPKEPLARIRQMTLKQRR